MRIAPKLILAVLAALAAAAPSRGAAVATTTAPATRPAPAAVPQPPPVPEDFPRFHVPGAEREMDEVRQLFWLHYPPAARAMTPTLYDDWLASAALWPATTRDVASSATRNATRPTTQATGYGASRARWRETLATRVLDEAGYVGSHQHVSMAHPLGWPLPPGHWGDGGAQWHFSFQNTIGGAYRHNALATPADWTLHGIGDARIEKDAWHLRLNASGASVTSPVRVMKAFQMPFLLVNWHSNGLKGARPYIEWTTPGQPEWSDERRVYLPPAETGDVRVHYRGRRARIDALEPETIAYEPVAMFRHPEWTGDIRQLRLGFGNDAAGADVVLQAIVSSYDTRHNVNNQAYILGCATYVGWTGDLAFLRENVAKMRRALRFMQDEYGTLRTGYVTTPWVGHEGGSGIVRDGTGPARALSGRGVGSNYWDLLPFGGKDAYATILYYGALQRMIEIERQIARHPEWNVSAEGAFDVAELEAHAATVKRVSNEIFWSERALRFVGNIDEAGVAHDYGFTFVNLEAIHYGLASDAHARQIMDWLNGERDVEGDTSRGRDIYHWRFGPRATTKRNEDYYTFWWSEPEKTPWGGQVQDGGAVLAFSYHDLMARLRVLGPDDAWARLREIAGWFGEVRAAGGYRAFYAAHPGGATLQGGGTAGGLGLDHEFKESVLMPQVMLDGFMGFVPRADGFALNPRLPSAWPELAIDRIAFHDRLLRIRATPQSIEIAAEPLPGAAPKDEVCWIALPPGEWKLVTPDAQPQLCGDGSVGVRWGGVQPVRFTRAR